MKWTVPETRLAELRVAIEDFHNTMGVRPTRLECSPLAAAQLTVELGGPGAARLLEIYGLQVIEDESLIDRFVLEE